MGRRASPQIERLWRGRLERQASGGSSISAFCRREGISQAAFYQWRRRLASQGRLGRTAQQSLERPLFVPVEMPATDLAGLVVELPGGAVVRLPRDAASETIAAVVQAAFRLPEVEEQQPC